MTSRIHQNPLHAGLITHSAEVKARNAYVNKQSNGRPLEEFERMAASLSNNEFTKRFTGNISESRSKSRSKALSRSKSRPRVLFRTKSLSRSKSRSRSRAKSPLTTRAPGPRKGLKKPIPRPRQNTKKINPSILGNINSNNAFAERYKVPTSLSPHLRSSALPRAIIKNGKRLQPRVIPRKRVKHETSNIHLLDSILTPGPENAQSK
jgi:hypothetical protein